MSTNLSPAHRELLQRACTMRIAELTTYVHQHIQLSLDLSASTKGLLLRGHSFVKLARSLQIASLLDSENGSNSVSDVSLVSLCDSARRRRSPFDLFRRLSHSTSAPILPRLSEISQPFQPKVALGVVLEALRAAGITPAHLLYLELIYAENTSASGLQTLTKREQGSLMTALTLSPSEMDRTVGLFLVSSICPSSLLGPSRPIYLIDSLFSLLLLTIMIVVYICLTDNAVNIVHGTILGS